MTIQTETERRPNDDCGSKVHDCCICFQPMRHPYIEDDYLGNNALQVKQGRCCDLCDCTVVLATRYRNMGCLPESTILEMVQSELISRMSKVAIKKYEISIGKELHHPEWMQMKIEIEKEMRGHSVPFTPQEVA